MSWTRKLLLRSLRARLIFSFGVLIFLSLFLAGTTTVYLLKDQQEQTAQERIGRLALPIAQQALFLEAGGMTPAQIEVALESQYSDVRILLIDRDATVVSDTGNSLRGAKITEVASPEPASTSPQAPRFHVERLHQGENDLLLFTAPPGRLRVPGVGVFNSNYQTIIAVRASDVSQAWRALLPRLFLAGGVSLLASVVAAGLLARSISRPLRRITLASEEMARGRYDQRIPSYGGDEVGRLAEAFNEMASQVSRSNRTLRDFLANVSHELKTPLTSIQGFSQAMIDGVLERPKDFAEAGRIINDESIRMRGLVDDLLYLSQMESGEFVMHFDRLSPNELLRATRERFERRAEQSSVTLEVQPGATPRISADERRLEQALANIVDNAIRHTPSGGRVILRSMAEDGHVQLAVHNTGSVIPEEALPKIFDRFFQADPGGVQKDANTGLGLAITKEIIEAHRGEVEVTSSAAAGTEFVITLPVDQAVEPPSLEPAAT